MPNFRFMSFSIEEKKIAELVNTDVKFMTNGEQQIGTDEVLGESIGVVTSEANWESVEPVEGTEIDFDEYVLNQTPVTLSYEKRGKIYRILGKIIESNTSSQSKTGATTSKYQFRGGKPERV